MSGKPVAFAERECDLVKMTIMRMPDGSLIARPRKSEDIIVPTHQTGEYNDLWVHVRSGGQYIRHDSVYDEDAGKICYDYSSCQDGRLWLRPISEWEEKASGRSRFERVK